MKDNLILIIAFLVISQFMVACSTVPGYHDTMQGVQEHVDRIRDANAKIQQGQLP